MNEEQIEANTLKALDFTNLKDVEEDVGRELDRLPIYKDYITQKRFLTAFVDKFIVVDPIDREIWGEKATDEND